MRRSSCKLARTVEASHSATASHCIAASDCWDIVTPPQKAEGMHALLPKRFEQGLWKGESAINESGWLLACCVMVIR